MGILSSATANVAKKTLTAAYGPGSSSNGTAGPNSNGYSRQQTTTQGPFGSGQQTTTTYNPWADTRNALYQSIAAQTANAVPGLVRQAMNPAPRYSGYTTPDAAERHQTSVAGQYQDALGAERDRLMAQNGFDIYQLWQQRAAADRGLAAQPLLDANARQGLQIDFDRNMALNRLDLQANGVDQGGTLRDIDYYGNVYNNQVRQFLAGGADAEMAKQQREQQMREQLAVGGAGWTQGLTSDKKQSNYQYDATIRDLNVDLERKGLDRDQQVAQANDRLKKLKLTAEGLNVSATALQRALQNQIDRLGLNGMLTVGQLMDQQAGANTALGQFSAQITAQAIASLNQQTGTQPTAPRRSSPQRNRG